MARREGGEALWSDKYSLASKGSSRWYVATARRIEGRGRGLPKAMSCGYRYLASTRLWLGERVRDQSGGDDGWRRRRGMGSVPDGDGVCAEARLRWEGESVMVVGSWLA